MRLDWMGDQPGSCSASPPQYIYFFQQLNFGENSFVQAILKGSSNVEMRLFATTSVEIKIKVALN